jgi:hypothetical protein
MPRAPPAADSHAEERWRGGVAVGGGGADARRERSSAPELAVRVGSRALECWPAARRLLVALVALGSVGTSHEVARQSPVGPARAALGQTAFVPHLRIAHRGAPTPSMAYCRAAGRRLAIVMRQASLDSDSSDTGAEPRPGSRAFLAQRRFDFVGTHK